ncbi:class I SAM-dependent methyltransferase [Vibrio sp. SM6]|uniref:Class I SAM-dependent methyltransferase n=1 Tax=Vibrio agarilyticus TaxID=2726741 RepID=A0A7X8YFJ4_9VIBR|nr:class I SAM-dependent methyltransferase [Vibrio agarilyticus]NLS11978.1 class I SAM-dependent methyltransferase [Vibrio agarilyticus]
MSLMYTEHARQYGEVVKNNIYNALLERPSTQALLGDVKGKRVLDLGCGSGVYAQWLLERGAASVTCLDASHEMIALVKESLDAQVTAYVQDLSVGFPCEADDSIDVMICPLVLHYVEDLTPFFADVQRVLKPGGYLVFSTHHPFADFECSTSGNYFARECVEEQWNTIGTPVTVRFFRRSLTELMSAATSQGLVISGMNEGVIDPQAQTLDAQVYARLSHNPNFLFVRCEKPRC